MWALGKNPMDKKKKRKEKVELKMESILDLLE